MLYHTEKDCFVKLLAIDGKLESMKIDVSDAIDVYAIDDIQALVTELMRAMERNEE